MFIALSNTIFSLLLAFLYSGEFITKVFKILESVKAVEYILSFTALLGVIPFCSRANRFNSASYNKAFLNLLLLDTMALATFINLSSPIPSIVLVKL